MKLITKAKGNFEKITSLLQKYTKIEQQPSVKNVMEDLGNNCVKELSERAPVKTGEYAASFESEVERQNGKISANIYNGAHPEASSSGKTLTELITYGHGNGHGGYTRPNKFVSVAVKATKTEVIDGVIANVK